MGNMVMILPGMLTPSDAAFKANDCFSFQRNGSVINYYKNGNPIYTYKLTSTVGALYVHAFLNGMDNNGSATNLAGAMVSGAMQ